MRPILQQVPAEEKQKPRPDRNRFWDGAIKGAGQRISGAGFAEGLIQIGDNIIDILDPDRNAHHIGAGPGRILLFRGQLAVSCAG